MQQAVERLEASQESSSSGKHTDPLKQQALEKEVEELRWVVCLCVTITLHHNLACCITMFQLDSKNVLQCFNYIPLLFQ